MVGQVVTASLAGVLVLSSAALVWAAFRQQPQGNGKLQNQLKQRLATADTAGPLPNANTAPKAAAKQANSLAKSMLKKRSHNTASWRYKMELKLERANLLMQPWEFVALQTVLTLVLFCTLFWLANKSGLEAGLWAVGGWVGPNVFINLRVWLRIMRATSQFPDVLDNLVSCFKTGYGLNRAVQQVAENFHDPWGTEFSKMAVETSLGSATEDILSNLQRRIPTADVDLFVASLLIQKDTGGNLAEMLGNLSTTCRERQKLTRKVSAISAQGKLTAGIVAMVPLVIMGLMYALTGDSVVNFLSELIGQIIMGVAVTWMLVGFVVLWKMVQIDV
jgi:tight adherence protein B